MKTVLRCGAIFDGLADRLRHRVDIVVSNGLIEAIEPSTGTQPADRRDALFVDASSLTAIPGLIDTHVHLAGDYRQQKLIANQDPAVLTALACHNSREALRAGLTTVRDCGCNGAAVKAVRQAIADGLIPGPSIIAAGQPITATGGHMAEFSLRADGREEVVKAVRHLKSGGSDFIKVAVTGGGGTFGTNIFNSLYTGEELAALCGEAHRLGLKVAAHAHGTAGIGDCVRAGIDFIEHCSWLSEGGLDFDESIARQIREHSTWVGITIGALHHRPLNSKRPELREIWAASRDAYPSLIRRMKDLGVNMTIGTDAGVWETRIDQYAQALEDLVNKAGLSSAEVLAMATSNAASALGCQDRGVLAPGKRADLALIEGDPLENIRSVGRVRLTMADGKIYTYVSC